MATRQWDLSLEKLKTWMNSTHTSPSIHDAILNRLKAWHDNVPPAPFNFMGRPNLRAAILAQDDIGWHPFLLGMVSTKLADVQSTYYLQRKRRNTGLRWLVALIKKLWDISWDMWQQRNDINHNTMTPRKILEMEDLHAEVHAQFERGTEGMLPSDHHWMQDKNKILTLPMDRLKLWLQSVRLARNSSVHVARARLAARQGEQQLLRNWLNQT